MHGKLMSQNNRTVPERHPTLLLNTFVFQNTAKFSCMYICNCTNYILQTFLASRGNIGIWFPLNTGWLVNDSSTTS